MISRRSFLGSILALGAAPVIVRADSLMRIYVPPQIIVVRRYFNGVHDKGDPLGQRVHHEDITMTIDEYQRRYTPDRIERPPWRNAVSGRWTGSVIEVDIT